MTEITKFAVPALALWLTGPLLSLIDSSAVGLSGGKASAIGLAALGPATTLIDGSAYLFAFINVATTNLYATALARNDPREAELVTRTSIKVALWCGLGVSAVLLSTTPWLLKTYVGGAAALILPAAVSYSRVRGVGMITLLISNAVQAALLGSKDSMTPLKALSASALFNAIGDIALVCWLGFGVTGAAVATVASQLAGLALLMQRVLKKGMLGAKIVPSAEQEAAKKEMFGKFFAFAPPVLLVVIGKMATFGFMTHVAAAKDPIQLAAHQVCLSLFFFLAPFTEVSSQTAQSFLPTFEEKRETSQEWALVARRLVNRLQVLAVGMGVTVAALGALIPRFAGSLFTQDLSVVAAMKPLAMPLFLAGAFHGFICSAEGVLLVRRDLDFLGKIYAASAIIMPAVLLQLKRRAAPVPEIWAAFVWFQAVRALILNLRVRFNDGGGVAKVA